MDQVVQLADRSLRSMQVMEQHVQNVFGGLIDKSKMGKMTGGGDLRHGTRGGKRRTEMELFMMDEYTRRLSLLQEGRARDDESEYDDDEYYDYDYSDEEQLKTIDNEQYWIINRRYQELSLKRKQEYKAIIAGGNHKLVKGSNIRQSLADQVPTFFKNRTLQPIVSPIIPQSAAVRLPTGTQNRTKCKEPLPPIKRLPKEMDECTGNSKDSSHAFIDTSMGVTSSHNRKLHETNSSIIETQRKKRQRTNSKDCEDSISSKRQRPERCINTTTPIHDALKSCEKEGTRLDDRGDGGNVANDDIVLVKNEHYELDCGSGGRSLLSRSFDDDNEEMYSSSSSDKLLSHDMKQEEIVAKRERDEFNDKHTTSNADSISSHSSVLSSEGNFRNDGVVLQHDTSLASVKQEGFVAKRDRDELDDDDISISVDSLSSKSSILSSSEGSNLEDDDISKQQLLSLMVKGEVTVVKKERDELNDSYTSPNMDSSSSRSSISSSSEDSNLEDNDISKNSLSPPIVKGIAMKRERDELDDLDDSCISSNVNSSSSQSSISSSSEDSNLEDDDISTTKLLPLMVKGEVFVVKKEQDELDNYTSSNVDSSSSQSSVSSSSEGSNLED